jgi:threonine synthase
LKGLKCRECSAHYELAPKHVCEFCFGPLEVEYDYDVLRKASRATQFATAPTTSGAIRICCPSKARRASTSKPGFTPLVRARNLGKLLGIKELYIKNDTANPTWSFKDRVVSVALSRAVEFGFDTAACASTGNLANSVRRTQRTPA